MSPGAVGLNSATVLLYVLALCHSQPREELRQALFLAWKWPTPVITRGNNRSS